MLWSSTGSNSTINVPLRFKGVNQILSRHLVNRNYFLSFYVNKEKLQHATR